MHITEEASIREDNGINISAENNHSNTMAISAAVSVPALQLKAGVRTQRVRHLMATLLGVNVTF